MSAPKTESQAHSASINGRCLPIAEEGLDLANFLQQADINLPKSGAALAKNGHLIPKHTWPHCRVFPNDELELLFATQGG